MWQELCGAAFTTWFGAGSPHGCGLEDFSASGGVSGALLKRRSCVKMAIKFNKKELLRLFAFGAALLILLVIVAAGEIGDFLCPHGL